MRIGRYLVLAAMVLAPAIGAGCDKAFLFSKEQEIAMGNDAAPELEKEFDGKLDDPSVQNYVHQVGQKLAAVAERDMPYNFAVLRSETPNAFALPGGRVYITVGLMRHMENERQLAAVLGHEIGHVVRQDNVKGIQRQLGVQVLATIAGTALEGSGGQIASTAAKLAGAMVNLRYDRKQEYRADKCGAVAIAKAGYSPWGTVEVLQVLYDMDKSEGGSFTEMFQTHPLTSNRIDEARQFVQDEYASYPASLPDPNRSSFLTVRSMLGEPKKQPAKSLVPAKQQTLKNRN